jgi:hypothetical protein
MQSSRPPAEIGMPLHEGDTPYHGSAQHLRSGEQRRAAIDGAILQSRETRDLVFS